MEAHEYKAKILIQEYFWAGEVEKSHSTTVIVLEGDHRKAVKDRLFGKCGEIEILHAEDGIQYNEHILYHGARDDEFTANFWHKPVVTLTSEGNTLIMQFGEYKGHDDVG